MRKFAKIAIGYMVRYLLGFLMVFSCSIMVFNVAKDSVESYIVKQAQMQTQEGVQKIDAVVEKMELISQMMYQNPDFYKLIYQGDTFSKADILLFRDSNNLMIEIGYLTDYIPYMFTVFNNNDLYLSSSQCSTSFSDYYGEFMSISTPEGVVEDSSALKELIFNVPITNKKFLKLESIRYIYDTKEQYLEDALLYLTTGTEMNYRTHHKFCFIINKEYLLETILMSELKADGFLSIQDGFSGEELLSWGISSDKIEVVMASEETELQGYHVMKLRQDKLGWDIVMGIPVSFIDEQMKPVQSLLVGYLCLGFIAVIGLTLYFSMSRYYGVKQHYLQLDELRRRNKAILLENLITNGTRNSDEQIAFKEYFEVIPEFYCVVIVRFLHTDILNYEAITIKMMNFLQQKNVKVLENVHSGVTDELFFIELFPWQETNLANLQKSFEDMADDICKQFGLKLHIGISAIGTKLNNVNKCYEQAKRIVQAQYMFENENMVKVYDIKANSSSENPITMEFMNRLYTMLVCGQGEDVQAELRHIGAYYVRMNYLFETNKEQIFYSLRNVYYTAVLQLNCKDWEQTIPVYTNSMTCQEMIMLFEKCTIWICEQILQCKKSKNQILKKEILQYIAQYYSDPGLSAYVVSREVGISEKYFYQFWKEQMGESFSNYLLHLRIEKAKEYLTQTDYSNEQIATLVGFVSSNTFYRNFNKLTGVTPKTFKENA